MIQKFLRKNKSEIENDRHLQLYGTLLGMLHLVTAYFFINFSFPFNIICWPFLVGCQRWNYILIANWNVLLVIYAVGATACSVSFIMRKTGAGLSLLALVSILKFLLQMTDYRLMGNYHYMFHLIVLVFLFLPNKKNFIKIFIIGFYFVAGLLKFNSDWLGGELIKNQFIKNDSLLQTASAYAVIIELFFSFFLLSSRRGLFYLALVQIIIFHCVSWFIVGYYYPVIMLTLLSIFYMKPAQFKMPPASWSWIFVGLFVLAQVPSIIFADQSALSGQWRLYSLNMLDAKTECNTHFYIQKKTETIEYHPSFEVVGPRIHCDPVVVVAKANETCEFFREDAGVISIRLDHQVRRLTNSSNIIQMSFDNICNRPLKIGISGDIQQ